MATGLAVVDHVGSVRNVVCPIWTRSVECPTHVIVGTLPRAFSRRNSPLFASFCGKEPVGRDSDATARRKKNGNVTDGGARPCPGKPSRLRNPPSTWWDGGITLPVPPVADAGVEPVPVATMTPIANILEMLVLRTLPL